MISHASSSSSSSLASSQLFHIITYQDIENIWNEYQKNRSIGEHIVTDDTIKTFQDFLTEIRKTRAEEFISIENLYKLADILLKINVKINASKDWKYNIDSKSKNVKTCLGNLQDLFGMKKLKILYSLLSINLFTFPVFVSVYTLPSADSQMLQDPLCNFIKNCYKEIPSDLFHEYLDILLKNPAHAQEIYAITYSHNTYFTPNEIKSLCKNHPEGFKTFANDLAHQRYRHSHTHYPAGYKELIMLQPQHGSAITRILNWLDVQKINTEENRLAIISDAVAINKQLGHLYGYYHTGHSDNPRLYQLFFNSILKYIKNEQKFAFLSGLNSPGTDNMVLRFFGTTLTSANRPTPTHRLGDPQIIKNIIKFI